MSQVRVKLTFPESEVRRAVLATLEDHRGWIVCELDGDATHVESAVAWLRQEGIAVDLLGDVLES